MSETTTTATEGHDLAHVIEAWLQLLHLVQADPPPCTADPDAWTGDEPDLDAAAYGCWRCPAFIACGRYADLAREPHGVWAATVRGRPGRPRALPPDQLNPRERARRSA